MERLENWIARRAECFMIICLIIFIRSTCAQKDFVSISCCADSNFTGTNPSIYWKPDYAWFPDKTDCRNITRLVVNNNSYVRIREFNIDSGKRCYSLSTIKGQDYLIRGTFLYSDTGEIPLASSLNVLVGVTPISLVNSTEDTVVEGTFWAANEHIDFCLEKYKGDPFISQLELRPLNDTQYLNGESASVLKLIARYDLGRSEDELSFRYPYDPFDRIWIPKLSHEPSTYSISSSNVTFDDIANVTVPLQVLQTALINRNRLTFQHTDLDSGDYDYTLNLYFLELNDSVKSSGQRVFDILVNNVKKKEKFDILADGSNYAKLVLNIRANGSLNFNLVNVLNGSEFGPICNAYEILQVRPWVQETNQEDVNVIMKVRDALKENNKENQVLESWSGDPCLPIPWKGVTCSTRNGSIVITRLDLRNSDLQGRLSDSLLSLQHLTKLYYGCNPHLDNNLTSTINGSRLITDQGVCSSQKSTNKGLVIGIAACGTFLFTVAVGILVRCYRRKFMAQRNLDGKGYSIAKNLVFAIHSIDDPMKSISIQTFSLQYLETATQNYKTLIGEGGFGSVYRGTLTDGQEVAVKVRSSMSTQGTREFENEINFLSAIRHENLVLLLGYCCENDQQILVYPFMSNGSLQDRLYGEAAKRKTLDWPTRLSIALGAARGLMYLHTFAGRSVIHRDVKSSNILLDHSMCAKVADFGFSKYAPQEGDSGASLEVRGTAGYLDPEYYSTQQLSAKSDVFSFGVVLLEIISGREPLNINRPRNEWSLVEWAKPFIRESRIEEIVDPSIKGGYHAEAMWRMVEVALACIEPFSAYRPSMVDIVRELEDAFIIENNASEYMKSIDSIGGHSLGGSARYSRVLSKRIVIPPAVSPPEPSPVNTQTMVLPEPR